MKEEWTTGLTDEEMDGILEFITDSWCDADTTREVPDWMVVPTVAELIEWSQDLR